MGQTCKQLKTRISEHKGHISENTSTHSVITEQSNHDFDWEDVEILDVERNFNKRLISKMINIKGRVPLHIARCLEFFHWTTNQKILF